MEGLLCIPLDSWKNFKEIPRQKSDAIFVSISEEISEENSIEISERIPGGIPQGISEENCEGIPAGRSKKKPGGIPGRSPEKFRDFLNFFFFVKVFPGDFLRTPKLLEEFLVTYVRIFL